jgi:hypothetical protein
MTDKARHPQRGRRTPQGHLSNWVLALVAGGMAAFALLVKHLI